MRKKNSCSDDCEKSKENLLTSDLSYNTFIRNSFGGIFGYENGNGRPRV